MSAPSTIEIRLIELPLADRLAATHDRDPESTRRLVIVEVTDDRGRSGFGECSALNRLGYTDEDARGSFRELVDRRGSVPASLPMAFAAVEMAVLDRELRMDDRSLVSWLSDRSSVERAAADRVPAGPVLPLAPVPDTVEAARAFHHQGVRRLKLKVGPGHLREPTAAVRRALPDVELHIDGNGSFGAGDLDELLHLGEIGVAAIEQPFAVADRITAIELTTRSAAVIVADEAATDLAAVRALVDAGACHAVSIKPPRLGGLRATVELHDWCVANGVPATAGGMLESGLGRHALAAVAALPGFTIPGDVTPARRWLAVDPFPDLEQISGRVIVPTGPGVAPAPDRELLERHTIDRATFPWPSPNG